MGVKTFTFFSCCCCPPPPPHPQPPAVLASLFSSWLSWGLRVQNIYVKTWNSLGQDKRDKHHFKLKQTHTNKQTTCIWTTCTNKQEAYSQSPISKQSNKQEKHWSLINSFFSNKQSICISQFHQPTCLWKWVGGTNPQKSDNLTSEVNIVKKTHCSCQVGHRIGFSGP